MWKKGDGNNRTGWSSEEYEALLGKAELATDPAERIKYLRQAETIFLNDHPIVPIYWHTSVYLLHNSVKNWHPLPLRNQPYKFIDLQK
jgi:oligopeptide transport system substrate-binding protein